MQVGAMSLTSIVSDINGCNEIVVNGENGIIIPSKSKEALFEKMQYLFKNQDINKEIASKARGIITKNHERSYIWNEILKEYRGLDI